MSPPNVALLLGAGHVPDREELLGIAAYAHRWTNWRLVNYRQRRPAAEHQPAWPIHGVISRGEPAWLERLIERQGPLPVVTVRRDPGGPSLSLVSEDAAVVAGLAIQHLRAAGLEQFAMAGFPEGQPASDRLEAALTEASGAPLAGTLRRDMKEPSAWVDAASQWLLSLPRPVGVLTFHDQFGEWVMEAAGVAGLAVPSDVAVLSIHNDETVCYFTAPTLSSIDLDFEQLGYQAAALLDQLLATGLPDKPVHWRVPPRGVIERGSTDRREGFDPALSEAIRYIDAQLEDGVTVDGVAEAMGMSRRWLERRFDAIGISPRRFIEQRRLDRARELIVGTDAAIVSIASQLHFSSAARLSAAFRQRFGTSPHEYRLSHAFSDT